MNTNSILAFFICLLIHLFACLFTLHHNHTSEPPADSDGGSEEKNAAPTRRASSSPRGARPRLPLACRRAAHNSTTGRLAFAPRVRYNLHDYTGSTYQFICAVTIKIIVLTETRPRLRLRAVRSRTRSRIPGAPCGYLSHLRVTPRYFGSRSRTSLPTCRMPTEEASQSTQRTTTIVPQI